MSAIASTSAAEQTTLTLDHILSDLEALSAQNPLFALTRTSSAQPSGSGQTIDRLSLFESGSAPANRKEYVALSHQLIASHRTAQRLNSERVSAADVGLVLPSERRATGRNESGKLTRTDLLHAKVADLQTQVEAWHGVLERAAMGGVDAPRHEAMEVEQDGAEVGIESGTSHDRPHETTSTTDSDSLPSPQQRQGDQQASNPATSEEFEDDDPWNDLS